MVMQDQSTCPKCGGELKYYDSVPRLVRTIFGQRSPRKTPTGSGSTATMN